MTKEKRNRSKTIGERAVIRVPFFADEYDALGLHSNNSYSEAVAAIRSKTGCVIGARTRAAGVSKSALYNQFNAATPEQKKEISLILSSTE